MASWTLEAKARSFGRWAFARFCAKRNIPIETCLAALRNTGQLRFA